MTYRSEFLEPGTLGELIRSADVVVLPYDSREQVTSGVLAEAVACGVPVVATTFPHAVELLTDGPGLLVPHRDPKKLATAIRRILTQPGLAETLVRRGRPFAADLSWSSVAARYESLAGRLVHAGADPSGIERPMTAARTVAPGFTHLERLSDDTGLFEHARHAIVRREHGYCTDDVARGLVVTSREVDPPASVLRLAECYLAFLTHAQGPDGAFHNRMGHDRRWTDQPSLGDWWGRALWGLGTAAARSPVPWIREEALAAFVAGARCRSQFPHAMAFAGLGAAELLRADPDDDLAAILLADAATVVGGPPAGAAWAWPQDRLTYANAALAEVVIAAGHLLQDEPVLAGGLRMLAWLHEIQVVDGRLSVLPAAGWQRDAARFRHDQQPIEVAALADAAATAAAATTDPAWPRLLEQAVAWFYGDNDIGVRMWDPETGGGYDGLTLHGPNLNQGAESTLALIATLQHDPAAVVTPMPPVTRQDLTLTPDPRRVIVELFVPGEDAAVVRTRAHALIDRIAGLAPEAADALLRQTVERFAGRHRDLEATFLRHFDLVRHRAERADDLDPARRLLVGAYFTHEYAVEAAALCNPSVVAHPDQSGLAAGQLRAAVSVRQIGEGHLSSIGFATAVLGPGTGLSVDARTGPLVTGQRTDGRHRRDLLAAGLADDGWDDEVSATLLSALPERFDDAAFERVLGELPAALRSRENAQRTLEQLRRTNAASYATDFPADSLLHQRVLWPSTAMESNGMEDARFVRFTHDDGTIDYQATYTAYDGRNIAARTLTSPDLRHFQIAPMRGPGVRNKGIALFPRAVGGRRLALCRTDGETTGLTVLDDRARWQPPTPLHGPRAGWELIQTGNCGSPIETEAGWLVLTHGVGPMRQYAISAILLDRDQPERVIAELAGPLLTPDLVEREGYVPNVIYSCGALIHGGLLWLPYGASDARIGFATVPVDALIGAMTPAPRRLTNAN